MAPEMYLPSPGAVNRSPVMAGVSYAKEGKLEDYRCSPLYACLLASVFSIPMDCRRFPMVLVDSSTARIPFPIKIMA